MKQMINNHREIESLEDFIYYDKSTGKIKIKKPIVDGSGNPIGGATIDLIGTNNLTLWDEDTPRHMQLRILLDNQLDYSKYTLFLFTAMGSLFIFLSSPLLNNQQGLLACSSLITNDEGGTNIIKGKLTQIFVGEETQKYAMNVLLVPANYEDVSFSFETMPSGMLFGVKL